MDLSGLAWLSEGDPALNEVNGRSKRSGRRKPRGRRGTPSLGSSYCEPDHAAILNVLSRGRVQIGRVEPPGVTTILPDVSVTSRPFRARPRLTANGQKRPLSDSVMAAGWQLKIEQEQCEALQARAQQHPAQLGSEAWPTIRTEAPAPRETVPACAFLRGADEEEQLAAERVELSPPP